MGAFAVCEAIKHPGAIPKGSWLVHEENDVLLDETTDKGYTQGLRLGYTWQPECEWLWTQRFATFMEEKLHANALLPGDGKNLERWTSFGIGQHMFTPRTWRVTTSMRMTARTRAGSTPCCVTTTSLARSG